MQAGESPTGVAHERLVEFNNAARRAFPQSGHSLNRAGIRGPRGKDGSLSHSMRDRGHLPSPWVGRTSAMDALARDVENQIVSTWLPSHRHSSYLTLIVRGFASST